MVGDDCGARNFPLVMFMFAKIAERATGPIRHHNIEPEYVAGDCGSTGQTWYLGFRSVIEVVFALGADPEQLIVLEREGDRVVFADRVPDYRGFSAEDMLADDRLFATTVWNPDTERIQRRYEELVAIDPDDRSEADTDELRSLARSMRDLPLPQALDEEVRESAAEIQAIIQQSKS